MITCVDVDPLLVDLVRRARPDDEVVVVEAGEVTPGRPLRHTALVVGHGSPALEALDGSAALARTIVVAAPGVHVLGHPGPVLRRPVDAIDLQVALARVVPPEGSVPLVRAVLRQVSESIRPEGIFAIARVAALTAAIALEAAQQGGAPSVVLPLAMLVWAALRVWIRGTTPGLVTVDAVMAGIAIVATGGTSSTYLLVGAVVGTEVGYGYPSRPGAILVGVVALAGLVPLTGALARGQVRAVDLVTWGTLVPMAAVAGVMARRIQRSRDVDQLVALRQVNATLARLARQAQAVSGTLSVSTAVEDTLGALHANADAVAGVVLLEDDDAGRLRTVAGSFGLVGAAPARVMGGDDDGQVPPELDPQLPEGQRLVVPMRVGEVERGVIVAVVPWGRRTRSVGRLVAELAQETALAIDNARVFEGVRELSVDDERRRLARDLHDGVIQTLVHVGFELDLLRGELDDGTRAEVERLRGVVGRTVDEVRATVNGLRSVRLSDGLGPALHQLAREYRSGQVAVRVDVDPVDGLSPEAELQLLRIAQEAVSNAAQHAGAEVVDVRLWADTRGVHLQVDDDGMGMGEPEGGRRTSGERGVGMQAMRERADLLGAVLDVGAGAASGTSVRIDLPDPRRP